MLFGFNASHQIQILTYTGHHRTNPNPSYHLCGIKGLNPRSITLEIPVKSIRYEVEKIRSKSRGLDLWIEALSLQVPEEAIDSFTRTTIEERRPFDCQRRRQNRWAQMQRTLIARTIPSKRSFAYFLAVSSQVLLNLLYHTEHMNVSLVLQRIEDLERLPASKWKTVHNGPITWVILPIFAIW